MQHRRNSVPVTVFLPTTQGPFRCRVRKQLFAGSDQASLRQQYESQLASELLLLSDLPEHAVLPEPEPISSSLSSSSQSLFTEEVSSSGFEDDEEDGFEPHFTLAQ